MRAIATVIENPICHAGPGEWTIFERPKAYRELGDRVIAVPGTQPQERCLVITADLWQTFQEMSLWVEALCVHEWCLYTERIKQSQQTVSRGDVYTLLTARPDNRRPLTWEANQIDLLLMEGQHFFCPWTGKQIVQGVPYDLDHLVPLSVYPTNELWNLMPSEPDFNRNTKRDRLPSQTRLQGARPHLEWGYDQYRKSRPLAQALREDVDIRFATLRARGGVLVAGDIAEVVIDLMDQMAESRNLVRF